MRHAAPLTGWVGAAILASGALGQGLPGGVPATATELFAQARTAANQQSGLANPVALAFLAKLEVRPLPEAAAADFSLAFDRALALAPAPGAVDGLSQVRLEVKIRIEHDAVAGLAGLGRLDVAVGLARRADVPSLPLYSTLIQFGHTPEKVLDLIAECQRANGSTPFASMAELIGNLRPPRFSDERRAVIRAGLAAAVSNVNVGTDVASLGFLASVHGADPGMDPELEAALLGSLDALPRSSADAATRQRAGTELVQLLTSIAPARAAGYLAAYPAAERPAASIPHSFLTGPRRDAAVRFAAQHAAADPSAALARLEGIPNPQDRFFAYAEFADLERRQNPAPAVASANRAYALLSDAFLASHPSDAIGLALTLHRLGSGANAKQTIARCLNAAERSNPPGNSEWVPAATAAQARLLLNLPWPTATAEFLDTYGASANIDLPATVARELAWRHSALAPYLLAKIAYARSQEP